MELYKLCFILVAITFPVFLTMAHADDFAIARQKIDAAKPNINYGTFCVEKKSGEDKIACRIKDVPTVGFLVCKTPELEEVSCSVVINNEVSNIQSVMMSNVRTVQISPPAIDGVKCGEVPSTSCSGFLEKWVAPETGQFQQVRDHIVSGTVALLIANVKKSTLPAGLPTTAADLTNIKKYMMLNPAKNEYRQICDLQGFFLINGGFSVADVPLLKNTAIDGICWEGTGVDPDEPTTQHVLNALDQMISAFK